MGLDANAKKHIVDKFRRKGPIPAGTGIVIKDGSSFKHNIKTSRTKPVTTGLMIRCRLENQAITPYYEKGIRLFIFIPDTNNKSTVRHAYMKNVRYKDQPVPTINVGEADVAYSITNDCISPEIDVIIQHAPNVFFDFCYDAFLGFASKYPDAIFICRTTKGVYHASSLTLDETTFTLPTKTYSEVDLEAHLLVNTLMNQDLSLQNAFIISNDTDHFPIGALWQSNTTVITSRDKATIHYFQPQEFLTTWARGKQSLALTCAFWITYAGTDATRDKMQRCGLNASVPIKYLVSQLSDDPWAPFEPTPSGKSGEPPAKRRKVESPPKKQGNFRFLQAKTNKSGHLVLTANLGQWRWHARRMYDMKHNLSKTKSYESARAAEINLFLRPLWAALYWTGIGGDKGPDPLAFGFNARGEPDYEGEAMYFKTPRVFVTAIDNEYMFVKSIVTFTIDVESGMTS